MTTTGKRTVQATRKMQDDSSTVMRKAAAEKLTDPYGSLEYTVGNGDDFWCFDYHVDKRHKQVLLHAVINSETGSFIQDAEPPFWASYDEAVSEALRLVWAAGDWCAENDVRARSWGRGATDVEYFARCVKHAIERAQGAPYKRVPRTSKYRLVGNGDWEVQA